jgi:hypothetical protein
VVNDAARRAIPAPDVTFRASRDVR